MVLNVHMVNTKVVVVDLSTTLLLISFYLKLPRVSNICYKFLYFEIQIFEISNNFGWRHVL